MFLLFKTHAYMIIYQLLQMWSFGFPLFGGVKNKVFHLKNLAYEYICIYIYIWYLYRISSFLSHRIHVWYIHLVHFYGFHVGKYTIVPWILWVSYISYCLPVFPVFPGVTWHLWKNQQLWRRSWAPMTRKLVFPRQKRPGETTYYLSNGSLRFTLCNPRGPIKSWEW